jgi:K+-transporting ATPase A subunit
LNLRGSVRLSCILLTVPVVKAVVMVVNKADKPIPKRVSLLFGRMLKTKQQIHPHAIMIFVAMFVMFIGFLVTCLYDYRAYC